MVKAVSQRGLQYFEAICATRDQPAKHVMARLEEFPVCRSDDSDKDHSALPHDIGLQDGEDLGMPMLRFWAEGKDRGSS